ncbi:hypothetical protein Hanom_Chr12g01108871 [Helianthus anomalus]
MIGWWSDTMTHFQLSRYPREPKETRTSVGQKLGRAITNVTFRHEEVVMGFGSREPDFD